MDTGGVIECIGPAGSGKSTLVARLCEADPRFVDVGGIWGQPRPQLASALVWRLRTAGAALAAGWPLVPSAVMQMARVDTLVRRLAERAPDARHLVVDDGPLFALAWLLVFHEGTGGEPTRAWRRRTLQRWAPRLAAVIHLDADDALIIARIRARPKPHLVKDASDDAIRGFTYAFRRAFSLVLDELATIRSVPVLRVDAVDDAADGLASSIALNLGELRDDA